jgi:hypothetical protein
LSTDAGTRRGLRDSPAGKVALLLLVLAAAFLVSRSCGSSETEVSKEEAIEIAREEVAFTPERTQVRYLKRGLQSQAFWAVSLSTLDEAGVTDRVVVVLVDTTTGEIEEIRQG